jgi:GNAT superfamily N-acetyltransferase
VDDALSRAAANCAGAYREWAARLGHVTAVWPDLSVSDMGLPGAVPIDSAALLRPMRSRDELWEVLDRGESVFSARAGGPIQIWSAWPTPDLVARGYVLYHVPALVRDAGGEDPHHRPDLHIAPARSAEDWSAVGRLIDSVFECRAPAPDQLMGPAMVGDDLEVFVGRVDGRAVATATAFVSNGFCGVYAVATAPEARGRGYGEALTWAATRFRADLPAALQASPMGLPVYLRMGYRQFGEFALWVGARPAARPAAR